MTTNSISAMNQEKFDNILIKKDQIIKEQMDQIVRLKRELEGVASERDLLLCEVSNLRFELEMIELKRLQDYQLKTDRSSISMPSDVISFQESYENSYVNHRKPFNYSSLLVNQKDLNNSQLSKGTASLFNYENQYLIRKNSLRNVDVTKRFRVQTMYELSQDLLDKQIELLERKYGGIKARKAALTIQRAFRRYTLVNKFKAITAMAKAEKRLSRKLNSQCHINQSPVLQQHKNDDLTNLNLSQIPPEVPKRTSSISSKSSMSEQKNYHHSGDNASLSSIQSSCSDSSNEKPIDLDYKIKTDDSSQISIKDRTSAAAVLKGSEQVRKRQYRVGLNLFNKKPEKGISYLINRSFVEDSPQAVSRFLISRKGLSKQMIGDYLGNLQNPFNMTVLDFFIQELDFSGMQLDVALRKFQTYFRLPGEAQKIERLIEVFSHRYCHCNPDIVARLRSADTIFVLAFAIIMLNTDLHTPHLKQEKRMKLEDFTKNLRGIDDCGDIDYDILSGIYERVKSNEFKPGSDHTLQVLKVQSSIVGKKPNLAVPHRRLVCYCRLYEIQDIYKKERPGIHQREVFLFNDILVVTKIMNKKKNLTEYSFRNSFTLSGLLVTLFEVPYYPYGIKLSQKVDGKTLIQFNARNEHDKCKFAEDLKESVCEMDEMETIRIEAELERQKSSRINRSTDNRDSGVADIESCYQFKSDGNVSATNSIGNTEDNIVKRSALSNSLLDIHEQCEKNQRRNSVGSLDSGMSISFQPNSNRSTGKSIYGRNKPFSNQQSFLGSLFHKKN